MQSFLLKFTNYNCLEQNNIDSYHQNYIVSNVKTAQICLTGNSACGFSEGEQKFPLMLVWQNSVQLIKGTWRMCKHSPVPRLSCVDGG